MEPSRFYTGLVADLYAPLRGHVYDDPEPWHQFIVDVGEPALELGCGDGDPLLALRERGLDVEGVDSSPDMIARCQAAAAERGLTAIRSHLTADGQALIPLFIPAPTSPDQLGTPRELRTADGTVIRVTPIDERVDERERTRTTLLRYERRRPDGSVEQAERPWVLHWYDPDQFARLTAEAGLAILDVHDAAPGDPDDSWQVRLGLSRMRPRGRR
jgi:SAM-dependent methyltransferase